MSDDLILVEPEEPVLKSVRTFILRDYPFGDPDDEIKAILLELSLEGIKGDIVADTSAPQELRDHGFDLLIIDYGGMASMGASGVALHNLRYTINWLEDHPSVVAIVWTFFTGELVGEIYDNFADAPANLFIYEGKERISDEKWVQIRALLGVPEPSE